MLTAVAGRLVQASDRSVHQALETVATGTGASRVSLAVFRGSEFEMIAFVGRSLLAPGAQMDCGASSLFETTRRGEVFVEQDFQKSRGFDRPVDRLMLASGFRSACAIPLAMGSETLAALSLSSTSTGAMATQPVLDLRSLGALFCLALNGRDLWRPTRVLICHDDPLVAGGVARLLESSLQVAVTTVSNIHEAGDVDDSFDAVVSDVSVFGGSLAALRSVCPAARLVPLVVLASYDTAEHRMLAYAAGARFFLPKADAGTLPEVLAGLWDGTLPMPVINTGSEVTNPIPSLTRRESDVLVLLDEGLSVRQVARRLEVSETTTKTYVRGLFTKLDAHSRAQAVQVARRQGILQSLLAARSRAASERVVPAEVG